MWRAPFSASSSQLWQILRRCNSSFSGHSPFASTEFFVPPWKYIRQQSSPEIPHHDLRDFARGISSELFKDSKEESLSPFQRLDISFGHVTPSKLLICYTLGLLHGNGKANFEFLKWLSSKPGFTPDDESLSFFIYHLGRKRRFKSVHELLCQYKGVVGARCFHIFIKRLVKGGKTGLIRNVFDRMEQDYGFVRDRKTYKHIIWCLSDKGQGTTAEYMVKKLTSEFFPDDDICDLLIMAYCRDLNLYQARRLAGEMYRGGFHISATAYNSIIGCVCTICRIRSPFKLEHYAQKVLTDMDTAGVPRNVVTFNVMIRNLCGLRKTEDAMKWFHSMPEFGVSPNGKTFFYLTKSLYKAGMVGEGDKMLERLRQPGFEKHLKYWKFIRTLLSIERVSHALKIFDMMKRDGQVVKRDLYVRLMKRLVAHNRISRANSLFDEAVIDGVRRMHKPIKFKLDSRFMKIKSKPIMYLRPPMPARKIRRKNWAIRAAKRVWNPRSMRFRCFRNISRHRKILKNSPASRGFWQWRIRRRWPRRPRFRAY